MCVKLITANIACNSSYCYVSGACYNLSDILKMPRRLLTERDVIWYFSYKQPVVLQRSSPKRSGGAVCL
jgi:hypothetical protein